MSRRTRLESVGLDFDAEVDRKEEEKDVYKDKNIPEAPELPFSSPSIGKPAGRPTGSPTQTRTKPSNAPSQQ
jgi:hypothetical protein